MQTPSNLPPGVTDADIEAQCADDPIFERLFERITEETGGDATAAVDRWDTAPKLRRIVDRLGEYVAAGEASVSLHSLMPDSDDETLAEAVANVARETIEAKRRRAWKAARQAARELRAYAIAAENDEEPRMSDDAIDAGDLACKLDEYDYRFSSLDTLVFKPGAGVSLDGYSDAEHDKALGKLAGDLKIDPQRDAPQPTAQYGEGEIGVLLDHEKPIGARVALWTFPDSPRAIRYTIGVYGGDSWALSPGFDICRGEGTSGVTDTLVIEKTRTLEELHEKCKLAARQHNAHAARALLLWKGAPTHGD